MTVKVRLKMANISEQNTQVTVNWILLLISLDLVFGKGWVFNNNRNSKQFLPFNTSVIIHETMDSTKKGKPCQNCVPCPIGWMKLQTASPVNFRQWKYFVSGDRISFLKECRREEENDGADIVHEVADVGKKRVAHAQAQASVRKTKLHWTNAPSPVQNDVTLSFANEYQMSNAGKTEWRWVTLLSALV